MFAIVIIIVLFIVVLFLSIIFPARYLLFPLFFFFLGIYFVTFSEMVGNSNPNTIVVLIKGYNVKLNLFILLLAIAYAIALMFGAIIKNILIKRI